MTRQLEIEGILDGFLADGAHELADHVLDAALADINKTPQRRSWWPTWRFNEMNIFAKAAIAAAAVVVVAVLGYNLLPSNGPGVGPTPSPTPTPAAFHEGPLSAGRYVMTPFSGADPGTLCITDGSMPQCSEDPADDSIQVTLTVPAGYAGVGSHLIMGPDKVPPPYSDDSRFGDGVLTIERGSYLYSDPCHSTPPPDIAVGPTVDDFANAIADHPLLDATDPVDVTLAGYAGKYIDLQLPADVSECTGLTFWPWDPGVYAQGNSNRWHLWILDVDGIRLVIQSMDWPTTSPQRQAEIQSIVDSIQITP
jgi:hypothetical protein